MHPDLHEPAFAKWYTSDGLVQVAGELLGCKEEELEQGCRGKDKMEVKG